MRLKPERIQALSKNLVAQLLSKKMIRPEEPEENLARLVGGVITEELMVEDRLDAEVRKILDSHEADIEKGNVDRHQMFLMIKKQLAKERGVIL